jgi:CelD/BcsL family acetyltransferase involved in cellulose biosynthesis
MGATACIVSESHANESEMKIELSDNIGTFADVWPTLEQAGEMWFYAYQARDVLEVWLRTIGAARNVKPLYVRVNKDDGTPLMLIPLGIEKRHGLTFLGFLDGGVADYNSPVLFPGTEKIGAAEMQTLWDDIIKLLPRCDVVMLEKIPEDVEGVPNPFRFLVRHAYQDNGHLIDLRNLELTKKGVPTIIRYRDRTGKGRKLRTFATIEMKIGKSREDLKLFYDTLIRQKTRRYVESRGVDGFQRPGYQTYFWAMIERFAASGSVQMSAFTADDVPLATHWGMVARKRFYSLMPAYEGGEWAKYSPGMIHLEEMILWAIENGLQTFDLGVGDEQYKLGIETGQLQLYRGESAHSLAGRAFLIYLSGRRSLAAGPVGTVVRNFRTRRIKKQA